MRAKPLKTLFLFFLFICLCHINDWFSFRLAFINEFIFGEPIHWSLYGIMSVDYICTVQSSGAHMETELACKDLIVTLSGGVSGAGDNQSQ